MALDFPNNPIDGQVFTDPLNPASQWEYKASVPGWLNRATAASNIIFRGGIDLTQAPGGQYANIVSGNVFVVDTGASPVNGANYPGLSGNITAGTEIIYDGAAYHLYTATIPTASNTMAGIIRIATDAEYATGTAELLSVNPKQVKSTETALTTAIDSKLDDAANVGADGEVLVLDTGVPKWYNIYADQATVDAGTATDKAVTPASLAGYDTRITTNQTNITANAVNITTNTGNIATNTGAITAIDTRVTALENAPSPSIPTGSVHWFAAQTPPTGYLVCDGSVLAQNATNNPLISAELRHLPVLPSFLLVVLKLDLKTLLSYLVLNYNGYMEFTS